MADNADIVIRVKTDGITSADAQLKRLMETGIRVETVSVALENQWKRTAKTTKSLTVATDALHASMTLVGLAMPIAGVAALADQWTNLTNKLANANIENEKMVDIQTRVFDISQRTRTSLDATSTLYSRMARSLAQYHVTAVEVAQVTETINKAMIVSGATTAESTAAIIQFSQALQSGVLRGDEFRSVMEQAPRLGKMIADGLGVGTAGLRKLALQGQLTTDVVINAISKASNTIDEEFNRTIPTFSQNLEIATNNAIKFAGTTTAISGSVSALGNGIVFLSEHLEELSNIALIAAASLGGKMVSGAQKWLIAEAQVTASSARVQSANIAVVDGLTKTAAARYQAAQATLAQVAAERQAIQTAFAADKQYYKGISTLSALLQNTGQVRAATEAVAAAQATLATRMGMAAVASRTLTVGLTALSGVMSVLGGPVGLVLTVAAGWYMYSQNAKQADQEARNLAVSQDDLTQKLKGLTLAQQEALSVELQRASVNLADQLQKQQAEVNSLTQQYDTATRTLARTSKESWGYASASDRVVQTQGDLKIALGELDAISQKKIQTDQNLAFVQGNVEAATRGATNAIVLQNGVMTINAQVAQTRSDALVKALQAQNNEYRVAQYRLDGNSKAAAQLSDVQNRLGKSYADNKQFIDDYIAGKKLSTKALTEEQKGLVEFIDISGKAYEAQQALAQGKKADTQSRVDARRMERYSEQWDKTLEKVEARGATSIERLRLQQEGEIRNVKLKAERAKATEDELGRALNAITVKYARLRQEEADKYAPGRKIEREYQEAQQTISQIAKAGLLKDKELAQARLDIEDQYLKAKTQLQIENAVTEQETIRGLYDPVQAAQNQYNEELAALEAYHNAHLVSEEDFLRKKHELYTELLKQQSENQTSVVKDFAQSAASMGGSMATILDAAGKKSSGAYKAMFALSKSFAISQSLLNLSTAVSQAMADPTALTPVQKFANMAAVAAAGAGLVSNIMAVGMAHDGIDNVPKEGTWLLDKGERVVDKRTNGDLKDFLASGGSGGPVNITIVNNASGVNVTKQQLTKDDVLIMINDELTSQLPDRMAAELNDPYSNSRQVMSSSYQIQRRTT